MQRPGEWLVLAALLAPWLVLTALLPMPYVLVGLALVPALAALLLAAASWSRLRAHALGLDAEAWGVAGILSLGFSMALLLGTSERPLFEALCGECGSMQEARAPFCYRCGAA